MQQDVRPSKEAKEYSLGKMRKCKDHKKAHAIIWYALFFNLGNILIYSMELTAFKSSKACFRRLMIASSPLRSHTRGS